MESDWTKSSFSLIRGGLLYRLERRLGLINDKSLGIGKRIFVFCCLTWLPIVLLETIRFKGFREAHPDFTLYFDLRMNVRFLLAAPLMILAELIVEQRITRTLSAFEYRDLVQPPGQLGTILSKSNRWISGTPGVIAEIVILAIIACVTAFDIPSKLMGPLREWKTLSSNESLPPPMIWYMWFALPFFQFLQLRWIWRFTVWSGVLWKLARLRLNLFASHPDQVGGMGIISYAQEGFASLWIAISAGAASTVAFRVGVEGQTLKSYYFPIFAFVGVETLLLLVPLAFFMPQLAAIKRHGLRDYARLSIRYVSDFDQKWMIGDPNKKGDSFLGNADFQSMADLANSFDRVVKMRIFPAGKLAVTRIIFAGLLPFLLLAFLVLPIEQIVLTVFHFFF